MLEEAFAAVSRPRRGPTGGSDAKAELLARLGEPGFWEDEGRVAVLGGDRAARPHRGRPAQRALADGPASAPPAARPPSSSAAPPSGVLLLGEALDALEAGEPADAHAARRRRPGVRAARGRRCTAPGRASAGCGWRAPRSTTGRRYRWSASVTGFGALRTLRPEAGLHVLEVPDGRGGYDRRRVRVTVTPRRPAPGRRTRSSAATASARRRSSATPSAGGARGASTPSSPAASTSSSRRSRASARPRPARA